MSLCDSKILSQKISIKSNNVFYNFGPFIVLEPLSLFLVKSSNLELYLTFLCRRFNLSAVLQQPLSKMPFAENSSKQVFNTETERMECPSNVSVSIPASLRTFLIQPDIGCMLLSCHVRISE